MKHEHSGQNPSCVKKNYAKSITGYKAQIICTLKSWQDKSCQAMNISSSLLYLVCKQEMSAK